MIDLVGIDLIGGPVPYGATFLLGLLLGVLCGAGMILDSLVIELMLLGMLGFLISENRRVDRRLLSLFRERRLSAIR